MLRVTIELLPLGDERRARVLHVGYLTNDGGRSRATEGRRGDYRVKLEAKNGRPWRAGTVIDFPRKRLGAWDLLYLALRSAVGDRNP